MSKLGTRIINLVIAVLVILSLMLILDIASTVWVILAVIGASR